MRPTASVVGGDAGRRRARLALAAMAGAAVVVLAIVTAGVLTLSRTPERGGALVAPTSITASDGSDVTWDEVAGVALPASRLHGPRITSRGRAAGYSRSERGAAFAAVHVLIRTSAASGPRVFEPVLASQVVGTHAGAMKAAVANEYQQLRAQYGVPHGEPIPGGDARVRGYRIATFDAGARRAWVDVALASAQLGSPTRVVDFTVELRWSEGDWRVVAPPDGDWSSRATLLGSPPAGLIPYGDTPQGA
jgi:hypothetical protein